MLQFSGFKKTLVIMICLLGVLYASPNLIRSDFSVDLPTFAPGKKVSLGLDLQGGSYLLLQVDLNVVILEYLESITSSVRQQLRKSKIGYKGLGTSRSSVVLKIRKKEDFEEAKELIRGIDQGNEVSMDASGNIRISPRENSLKDRKSAALQQSIEIVRRRIDETGVREPTIQRQGESRILVQLPGVDDPERVKALLGQTAKMVFRLVDVTTSASEAMAGRVPPGSELLEAALVEAGDPKAYVIKKRVMVSGEHLIDAQATFQDGQPVVSFRFDTSGAKRFGKVTTDNVNRPFAIVLDNEVISAPVIREPILGGTGIISGNFTVASANDLALLLRAGALPAPLTVLEERSVGPGLGVDSIAAGKLASLIGICLVIGFMILSYGLFGIFANIALFFNVTLIVGALSVLQATLTLPGIAGIVLTIGMAVDANVLIFERIREEIALGRTPISAIDAGYKRALTTIIDSNLTTLFAALCLYSFGSGPIKGFSVTLAIGIVTSMFTAIMLTRLLIVIWLRRRKPDLIPI
ncbi:MAG: protein translocase subunit SecD [Rhodospirillaceae bacterium]|nr:protein translocase subunit SecD [Rhodospirillaceae bacterium]MBT6305450.1 protein translocase subunit SecD [Rhodospirillaceae bacterium]MDC0997844.1 protein translocase subunit SecD [Alphaproteobacteria bacterium]